MALSLMSALLAIQDLENDYISSKEKVDSLIFLATLVYMCDVAWNKTY